MTPDVNVHVAASRADHPQHAPALAWLRAAIAACGSGERLEILPMVASGFLRAVTHPKVFDGALGGNRIPDAWIAAAVRTLDSHLVSFDRGFGKLLSTRESTLVPIAA